MNQVTGTPMKTTIESDYEALLAEMRKAREYSVSGIGAREIAAVERKLERIQHNLKSMRVLARILLDDLARGKLVPTSSRARARSVIVRRESQ